MNELIRRFKKEDPSKLNIFKYTQYQNELGINGHSYWGYCIG